MAEQDAVDSLVSRRPKRSTAGNRMHVALAEMAIEEPRAEPEEDKDFFIDKDEQDVFESDFESTDEEEEAAADADGTVGEKQVEAEERRERRVARSKLDKATAAAHARNKVTFNPQLDFASTGPKVHPPNTNHGTSTGPTASTSTLPALTRQSSRAHTMHSTSQLVKRLDDIQRDRALAPKRTKRTSKALTQAQLIARALDNEEGNIRDHRDYLKNEERKRRRAKVVRATVTGPALKWISKVEDEEIVVASPPPLHPIFPIHYTAANATSMYDSVDHWRRRAAGGVSPNSYATTPHTPTLPLGSSALYGPTQESSSPQPYQTQALAPDSPYQLASTHASALQQPPPNVGIGSSLALPNPPPPPTEPERRLVKVGKNYIIHERGQKRGAKKPTWVDSMEALFGDHANWEEMKVFSSQARNKRPYKRPIEYCLFTGKVAPYREPLTGLPFADAASFRKARELLRHRYIWSTTLYRYMGVDESIEPEPVGGQDLTMDADTETEPNKFGRLQGNVDP